MQKTYPTLYARTSTGAVQIWYMEQDGNRFRSISGQQDGQKVTSEWTVAKPKNVGRTNAKTDVEQATSEIESKYKKHRKTGYYDDIADIDKAPFFEVMLAKSYGDYKDDIKWLDGVGVQIKYNGGRVVASRHGLFSRKGERYMSIPHIEEALKPFFVKFPDAVLDGEGFNFDMREQLNEIMKLLRKTVHITPADFARSKELIRFYVYDGFGFPAEKDGPIVTQNDGYLLRKKAIDNAFFAPCFRARYENIIEEVPTWVVHSSKQLEDQYQSFLADRHEGAILRILGQPYENKRSKFLLKYKPVEDAEYKVIAIKEGDGNWSGKAKTVVCQRVDGKFFADGTDTFDATVKGSMEQATDLLKNHKHILNGVWTIYYFGYTGKGKPNYAQFDIENYNKGN